MKFILIVKCVKSGKGFNAGELYPVVGWNNGVQIARENEEGDCVVKSFMTGGIGDGEINPWDGSGKPSFDTFEHVGQEVEQ